MTLPTLERLPWSRGSVVLTIALLVGAAGSIAGWKRWQAALNPPDPILRGHIGNVWAMAYHPGTDLIASGGDDKAVRLWSAQATRQEREYLGHTGSIYSVAFSPDGRLIASGSSDKRVIIRDRSSGDIRQTLTDFDDRIQGLAFSPDGQRLAIGDYGKQFCVYEVASGRKLFEKTLDRSINTILFLTRSELIVTGDWRGVVQLWDANTYEEIKSLGRHNHGVYDLAVTSDESLLASAGWDGAVKLWDLGRHAELATLKIKDQPQAAILCVAISPDDRWLAAAGHDDRIRIWDLRSKKLQLTLNDSFTDVHRLAFNASGDRLIYATQGGTVRMIDWQRKWKRADLESSVAK